MVLEPAQAASRRTIFTTGIYSSKHDTVLAGIYVQSESTMVVSIKCNRQAATQDQQTNLLLGGRILTATVTFDMLAKGGKQRFYVLAIK